jgi:hypothetical protein
VVFVAVAVVPTGVPLRKAVTSIRRLSRCWLAVPKPLRARAKLADAFDRLIVAVPVAGSPGKSKTQWFAVESDVTSGDPAEAEDVRTRDPVACGAWLTEIRVDAEASPASSPDVALAPRTTE